MAVSTYRIWERKDMGNQLEKEKCGALTPQIWKYFKKIKKF
jgi:hypothetical protein